MSESTQLLAEGSFRVIVKLRSNGQNFVNGVSSSYEDTYPEQLMGIISESELRDIISRLNDTLQSFWPCNACYVFGFACSPFTLGTSLLCPHYCISQSDHHAQVMLEQVSLKAKYFDRDIVFRIVKECCGSYVEISFPSRLLDKQSDVEQGRVNDMNDLIVSSITSHHVSILPTIFSIQPGEGPNRLKDN
jgi:hypothetical protein